MGSNSRPSDNGQMRPAEARDAVLAKLAPEEKAEMLLRAERVGPGRDDGDWVIAWKADQISADARRVEAAAKKIAAPGPVTLSPESLAAIEAAVTRAIEPPIKQAPAWPSRVLSRWPAVATALTRCWKWARTVIEARWPIALAGAALTLMLMAAISLSASVATRNQDVFLARELSTSAGVAALALARANPSLAEVLRSCPRDPQRGGRMAMTCHLWAIGEGGSVAHPTWMSTALAVISGWSAVWLTGALAASWVVIVALGWIKRGPVKRRIA